MMKYDVYFFEAFAEEAESLQKHLPGDLRAGYAAGTIQECRLHDPPAPLISIRTQSRLPLSWGYQVRAIISRSTGYDHLTAYADRSSTTAQLGYLPLYCARAVAEQAMLLWLALQRRLPRQLEQFKVFSRDYITGSETRGKTLLVVGAGNIGGEIIQIGQGLGMKVWAVDPRPRHAFASYAGFADKLPEADIIVCAMNLTADNKSYFSYEKLAGCKPGALFVNIARGELAPAAGLLRLLKEQRLGGVALDVYEEEEKLAVAMREGRTGNATGARELREMMALPNVICTPHNAFNTREAVERKSEQTAMQIEAFSATGKLLWPIPRLQAGEVRSS